MKPARILMVDDEPGIRQSLSGVLEDEGYTADAVESGEACLAALPGGGFELVLLDIWLPGMDGMEVLARIQEIPFAERPVVVMISGHGSIEAAVQGHQAGRLRFSGKAALHRKGLAWWSRTRWSTAAWRSKTAASRQDASARYRIIGESVPMKALRQQLALMAATNGRVLIYGESGTGKELVAHALHASQPARRRAVRGSQLRRHSRGADRKRAVRPHARAASPARTKPRSANSRRPTAARCSWTKWAT